MRSSIFGLTIMSLALGGAASAQGLQDLPDRPIARTEVVTVVKRQFAAMDANHDGAISQGEFEAYRARQARTEAGRSELAAFERIGPNWFDRADADQDGRVTLQEAEERPLRLFDMADTDGDGTVSMPERQVAELLMSLGGR